MKKVVTTGVASQGEIRHNEHGGPGHDECSRRNLLGYLQSAECLDAERTVHPNSASSRIRKANFRVVIRCTRGYLCTEVIGTPAAGYAWLNQSWSGDGSGAVEREGY